MPPFFMAVSMLASPSATPMIDVAFASPTFDAVAAGPMATGPFNSVYKPPFIGVTAEHPENDTAATTPNTNVASTLFIEFLHQLGLAAGAGLPCTRSRAAERECPEKE